MPDFPDRLFGEMRAARAERRLRVGLALGDTALIEGSHA
jgi:hypothetical protein